jgi:hypothetical protein
MSIAGVENFVHVVQSLFCADIFFLLSLSLSLSFRTHTHNHALSLSLSVHPVSFSSSQNFRLGLTPLLSLLFFPPFLMADGVGCVDNVLRSIGAADFFK